MKQWTSATAPGICAYDVAHTWKQDDRIVVVSGATWSKKYCGACGMRLFDVPPDTGEVRSIEDEPQYPKALLEFTGVTRPMDFDAKDAQLPPSDRADYDDSDIGTGSGNGAMSARSMDRVDVETAPTGALDTEGPPREDEASLAPIDERSRALREEVGF